MSVHQVCRGVWRWTVRHPEWDGAADWDEVVGSVYCETPEAVVVIDPLVPDGQEEADAFWGAFDRDVERTGLPVAVLVTCRWHVRSARAFRDRHQARVFAPTATAHPAAGVVTDLVRDGAVVVQGVVALLTGSPAPNEECVYILTTARTAVVGDVLLGDADGGLRVADAGWYANSEAERAWYRDGLAPSLRRITATGLDHLLPAHGAPVGPDPTGMLNEVLARHGRRGGT